MSNTTRQELVADFNVSIHKDISFFGKASPHKKWMVHHSVLSTDYALISTQIRDSTDPQERLQLLNNLQPLAQILAIIYEDGLGIHREAQEYFKDFMLCKQFHQELVETLNAPPSPILPPPTPCNTADDPHTEEAIRMAKIGIYFNQLRAWVINFLHLYVINIKKKAQKMFDDVQVLREVLAFWNWLRLCLVRVKKLLNTMLPFLKSFPDFRQMVTSINKYTDPLFPQLAWIFFIPRLFINLFLLLKHTFHPLIPHWIVHNTEEDKLEMGTRFLAQALRRWSQLINDGPWMIAGIIGCFYLGTQFPIAFILGCAFPVSIVVTTALYFHDLLVAIVNSCVDIYLLSLLQKTYEQYASEIFTHYVSYEKKRIAWNLCIASITCLGAIICFILPVVLPGAGIPFAGAFLLLCMSFMLRYARECVLPEPKNAKKLSTFFTPKPTQKDDASLVALVVPPLTSIIIPKSPQPSPISTGTQPCSKPSSPMINEPDGALVYT